MSAAPVRVLIIEDDPDVRSYLTNLLHGEGYQVISTAEVDKGLAMAQGKNPSLVILDAMLPGDDAQHVYIELKFNPELNHIPVVLLSTLTRRALWGSRFYGAGTAHKRLPEPDAFLARPPEADDFLAAVERLILGGCNT